PCRELALPVLVGSGRQGGFDAREVLFGEPFAQCDQQFLLGREMQIDRALRDIGAGGDVVDGRGPHALLEEQPLRGIHDLLAADFGRLGSWPGIWLWLHSSRSTLRNDGNRFIHNSATATVPKPPTTAAG